jgi:hypothetical protein
LESQGNGCAICGRKRRTRWQAFSYRPHELIDTDEVRGILCNNCNNGIGSFGDNVEGMLKAIEYLNNSPINALARQL